MYRTIAAAVLMGLVSMSANAALYTCNDVGQVGQVVKYDRPDPGFTKGTFWLEILAFKDSLGIDDLREERAKKSSPASYLNSVMRSALGMSSPLSSRAQFAREGRVDVTITGVSGIKSVLLVTLKGGKPKGARCVEVAKATETSITLRDVPIGGTAHALVLPAPSIKDRQGMTAALTAKDFTWKVVAPAVTDRLVVVDMGFRLVPNGSPSAWDGVQECQGDGKVCVGGAAGGAGSFPEADQRVAEQFPKEEYEERG